jgi:uncharacterized sulfatase
MGKAAAVSTSPQCPNIVFVFSDQQRWDTVGAYGNPMDITPNLDRMAREGVLFENAFTCQPVCGPARACLQTGKYATELGCFRNGIALPQNEKTLAHWLGDAGYETGYIGKWHLASTHVPGREPEDYMTRAVPLERRGGYRDYWLASDVLEFTSHGYDGYMFNGRMEKVEFKGYRVDCVTDFVLDFLDTRTGARPFFLFLSYIEPHHQNDHNSYEGPRGSQTRFADFPVPGDLIDTAGDWRENYPDYLGCINSLDHNLGRIRERLEDLGLAENTLLVYTSDHGSHFRTRNSEYKRSCHDGCIRIPLILHGPGFRGGRRVRDLVSLMDLPPTVLASGGVPKPPSMHGRPLQDLLGPSPAGDWPDEVFLQISESQVGRAIRTAKWKYSVSAPGKSGADEPGSETYVEEFLYDLEQDPHERTNLVTAPGLETLRADLAERLAARMVAAGESRPTILPGA